MGSSIRKRLTYANVISSLALFLVVSGGTAVALQGSNTVYSDDIVNGEVRTPDLAGNAVRSPKVADGSIAQADIAPNSLGGRALDESSIELGAAGGDLTGPLDQPALARGSVGSGHVVDNSLTGEDIRQQTLSNVDAKTVKGMFVSAIDGTSTSGEWFDISLECKYDEETSLGVPIGLRVRVTSKTNNLRVFIQVPAVTPGSTGPYNPFGITLSNLSSGQTATAQGNVGRGRIVIFARRQSGLIPLTQVLSADIGYVMDLEACGTTYGPTGMSAIGQLIDFLPGSRG